jgi:phosphatidylinositol alpha-1,6-mannosyltransferase
LGLFPYFGPEAVGGVQASARIAWDAILGASAQATLLAYANDIKAKTSRNGSESIVVNSKVKAIYKALTGSWSHDLVFAWHLGLLRLLPFFRFDDVNLTVMLLGIEAWKAQTGLTRKGLERANQFLTISNHTWLKFVQLNTSFKNRSHQTVYLGIGEPIHGPSPTPAQKPAALMLSRLSKDENYKGHREVIKCWPAVLRQTPDAELWIVGEGDLRRDLERLVSELKLASSVRFWGLVSEEVKEQLLHDCRCMVMPSRAEGFGLVYLEAMRVGRPCLVSTLDAGREVVAPPEAGLAANPDDEERLATAVGRLLADGEEWQRWSKQARLRYETNFTAKHFQDRLIAALFPDVVESELIGVGAVSHV